MNFLWNIWNYKDRLCKEETVSNEFFSNSSDRSIGKFEKKKLYIKVAVIFIYTCINIKGFTIRLTPHKLYMHLILIQEKGSYRTTSRLLKNIIDCVNPTKTYKVRCLFLEIKTRVLFPLHQRHRCPHLWQYSLVPRLKAFRFD